MDPEADPSFSAAEEPALEQKLFLSSFHSQTEGGAPILLQLLEFKTHLQEVVEELHIRRDTETRFEDEISKLVLEKQELEWEKKSLHHQIETMTKQNAESLNTVKKRFQVKLQLTEEEKGKYQVSAELKDKEINNLKEELKSLQLLKFNLEKKLSELEQKLALQSRTKDSHLNQLAEVERRFSALSKQCAMVKQAHDKLEQNVDEAVKINSKLTSTSQKQEEIIVSLKKELEEVRNKLIKEKMKSIRHEKTQSPSGREQHVQELQQKLHMEIEINKKLREENVAERAEKQKLMRSLQINQQLLLSQTQAVRRIEQELENRTRMFQALKQEHEVMRENRKAMEDKVAELTERNAASKTSWDKERATLLNKIKSEQLDLQAMKEAYEDVQQKCSELTLQASSQLQQSEKREMKDNGQSPLVPTQLLFSVLKGITAEETPESSSQLPDFHSLQQTVFSQAKILDFPKDAGAASKLAATGASGEQDKSDHQREMIEQIVCLTSSIRGNSEKATETSDTSDLVGVCESYLRKSSCLSTSNPECGSLNASVYLLHETQEENYRGKNKKEQNGEENKKETNNTEQQKTEVFQQEDMKSERNAAEDRTIPARTADSTDMHSGSEGSAKETERISNPETKDRGGGEVTDGVKERGQTAEHASGTPETQIPAYKTAHTTEASLTMQVNDFMDTELPSTVCEPPNATESVSQKATEKDGNIANEFTVNTKEHKVASDEDGPHILTAAVQTLCPEDEPMNNQSITFCQIPGDENPSGETSGAFPSNCPSQTNPTLIAGELKQENNTQESQINQREAERWNPSLVNANMTQKDENTHAPINKDSELMREPLQELSSNESLALTSVMANDEEDAQKSKNSQPNINTCETAHIPSSTSSLKYVSLEVAFLPDASAKNIQECTTTNTLTNGEDKEINQNKGDVKLSENNNESPETDCLEPPQKTPKDKRTDVPFDLSKKTCRSLFDWGSTQRKSFSSRPKSDGSVLQQQSQGAGMSGADTTGHLTSTTPKFIETRHNKVPLLITRASDLFYATSGSPAAAYLTSQQKECGEVKEETCRVAEADQRPLSISSFPVTHSNTSSKRSLQTNLECSKAPSSASGTGSESDWELSFSQERETQQSSFRAQISKIEQFLNSERLRLPKRRRTEN